MSFDDQVFIVSGGASGMGRATATLLAQGGANVVIADIDTEAGARVAESIGPKAVLDETDLRSLDAIRSVVARTEERFGKINGLANVAAVYPSVSFLDTTPEVWEEDRHGQPPRIVLPGPGRGAVDDPDRDRGRDRERRLGRGVPPGAESGRLHRLQRRGRRDDPDNGGRTGSPSHPRQRRGPRTHGLRDRSPAYDGGPACGNRGHSLRKEVHGTRRGGAGDRVPAERDRPQHDGRRPQRKPGQLHAPLAESARGSGVGSNRGARGPAVAHWGD